MVIKSQHVVGIAGAFALVGAAFWASAVLFSPPKMSPAWKSAQVEERSWAVEVTDLGPSSAVQWQPPARTRRVVDRRSIRANH